MSRVGFECAHCRHRLSVTSEWAGKAVRCPKCQQVVVAPLSSSHGLRPSPPPPPSAPDLSKARREPSETDSIFSDPDDDGDSLFGGTSETRKPILPPDADQPTVRVPGIPDPPLPARPPTGARTASDLDAGMPTVSVVVPPEATNPFRRMVDEVLTEQADEKVAGPEETNPAPVPRASGWMKWALLAVSVYAALATAAAVWGWSKVLAEKPAQPAQRK